MSPGGLDTLNQLNRGIVMLKKLLFCFAALSTVTLIGCNTVQGAGKDIERGGEKVQDAAQDVKKKM
jgi:entericidin B